MSTDQKNHLEDLQALKDRIDGEGKAIIWDKIAGKWKRINAVDAKEQLQRGLASLESPSNIPVPEKLSRQVSTFKPSRKPRT